MAGSETEHLVSMTNDIAANLGSYTDCSERVADHIKRFWTPRMRSLLLGFVDSGGGGLSDESLEALTYLRDAD
jgi:formate dehydrogenase subunit delta